MIFKQVVRHPLFASVLIHFSLVISFALVFYVQEHSTEEIPIEITEFIRNLGTPAPVKSLNPKKKSEVNPTAAAPSNDSGTKSNNASPSSSSGGGETVSEDYEVSQMPILLNEVRVPYPSEARAKNIQGNVVFDLLISSNGSVSDLKVVSSPDPTLTFAARNAVTLFKFRPARMGDKSVAIRIRYTYRFLLQ